MANWVKLKHVKDSHNVYVNLDQALRLAPATGGTKVVMLEGLSVVVKESPEEIFALANVSFPK